MANLIDIDNEYTKLLKEYHKAPSDSAKEREISKKLDALDRKIAEASAEVEYDWGED